MSVVLAGVRPEEIGDWKLGELQPVVELGLGAAPDAQAQAIERAIETGRRVAARGGHAVDPHRHARARARAARAPHPRGRAQHRRRRLADDRRHRAAPLGGETTVIALDAELTASGRIPALDLPASGDAARRAARRRQGRRGDRRGARRGACAGWLER